MEFERPAEIDSTVVMVVALVDDRGRGADLVPDGGEVLVAAAVE